MECLNDDLGRAQIALDEAEAREQEAVVECQRALKVFKFKKYKEGYEDGKCEVSPKYSLDIGFFLRGEGQDPPESSATHAARVEASHNPLYRDAAPLMSGLLPTALDTKRVADIS